MALIASLRGNSAEPLPFFDPGTLRGMLSNGLEGSAEDKLARSLEVTDGLDSAIERYRASVERSLDAYVEELANPDSDAVDLDARLATHDRERVELMQFIIQSRQGLFEILDDEEWDRVFKN